MENAGNTLGEGMLEEEWRGKVVARFRGGNDGVRGLQVNDIVRLA
jgi:hypothetical protein